MYINAPDQRPLLLAHGVLDLQDERYILNRKRCVLLPHADWRLLTQPLAHCLEVQSLHGLNAPQL